MLLSKGKITEDLVDMLMTWRHSGFNVFCVPRIQPGEEKAKILKHLGLWDQKARPPLKRANAPPPESYPDYSDSHVLFSDDYFYCDPDYPFEAYEQC